MRRSVREASLGFCLLVAIASGLGLWFWLKGISLGRQTWTMEASFQDAAGLAPRSPVSLPVDRTRLIECSVFVFLLDLFNAPRR